VRTLSGTGERPNPTPKSQSAPSGRGSKAKGGLTRLLREELSAAAMVLTGIAGRPTMLPAARRSSQRSKLPPPGEFFRVEDGMVHVLRKGDRGAGPTVILESGAFGVVSTWAWIQDAISRRARVIAYDRPGLAWSDPISGSRDAATMARHLRSLLHDANERGPFILVGHSLGGMFARMFAHQFPEDVAGMVLVDSSHPDQFHYTGGVIHSFITSFLPALARLGVCRAAGTFGDLVEGLPDRQREEVSTFLASGRHLTAACAELDALNETVSQLRDAGDLGDKPLYVLTASAGRTGETALWHILQRDLKALSSEGRLRRIKDATHSSLLTKQEHASAVVAAVLEVIDQVDAQAAA